jgi:ribose transport system permease protein
MSTAATPENLQAPRAPKSSSTSSPAREVLGLLGKAGERGGLVVLLAVAIVVFSIAAPDTFPTSANLQSILQSNSVLGVIAIAAVIPFVAGQFDLSIAANAGFGSLVCGALMSLHGWALIPAILVAIALTSLVGLINGVVVARLGVNSIITTLGTASVLSGLVIWISKGNVLAQGISPKLLEFGSGKSAGIPHVFFVLIAVVLVAGYLLRQTPFGRSLYAMGDNERAAQLVGMPVGRMTVVAFVIGGALAGCGGVLQVSASGAADPQFGPNLLLPALSAVFLGATAIRPGEYNVIGTLIAVAFNAVSISGLLLAGVADWVQPVYIGVTLVVAVALSTVLRKRRTGQ